MNRRSFFSRLAGAAAVSLFGGTTLSSAKPICLGCGSTNATWLANNRRLCSECHGTSCGRTEAPDSPFDLPEPSLGTPGDRGAYEEHERRIRERQEAAEHRRTCPDCSRSLDGQRLPLPWATAPILSSRALWTLPVGSIAIVGRGGRPVERIDPYFYDVSTDTFRKDVRVRLLAGIRCGRLDVPKGVDTVQRPDGNWIIRAWDAVDRHEPRTIITCPKCSHACGNIVDHKAGITLSCQYCGYVTKA